MRIRCKNRWQHSFHTFTPLNSSSSYPDFRRVLRHQFVIRSECRYSFGAGSVEPMILEVWKHQNKFPTFAGWLQRCRSPTSASASAPETTGSTSFPTDRGNRHPRLGPRSDRSSSFWPRQWSPGARKIPTRRNTSPGAQSNTARLIG